MDKKVKYGVIKALEQLGIRVRPKPGRPLRGLAPGEEIWVLGRGPQATLALMTPFREGRKAQQAERELGLPRLWVAECFGTATAERLIAAGDGVVDAAGNAHLKLPGMFIHVLGKKGEQKKRVRDEPMRRALRTPAIRILFHLLCEPELAQRPVREIAKRARTAPGTVVNLFRGLEYTGNLVQLGGHKRRFVPDDKLVDLWIDEYGRKLRHVLLLGRFKAQTMEWWQKFDVVKHGGLWGGEVAARRLGAELCPGVMTLYTNKPITRLMKAARLVPDEDGDIEIRKTFWTGTGEGPRVDVVQPLLVVADLMATRDGRCWEAAQFVRERFLDGPIEQD